MKNCKNCTHQSTCRKEPKINGDKVGTYDGYITIFTGIDDGAKIKRFILTADGTDNDKFLSLNDCRRIIGESDSTVFVIFDDYMSGKMYCWGNYGDCWTEYGTTNGFA